MEDVYRVSVIQNTKGRFYVGMTDDTLNDHNSGVSVWTEPSPLDVAMDERSDVAVRGQKARELSKRQKGGSGFFKYTGLSRFFEGS